MDGLFREVDLPFWLKFVVSIAQTRSSGVSQFFIRFSRTIDREASKTSTTVFLNEVPRTSGSSSLKSILRFIMRSQRSGPKARFIFKVTGFSLESCTDLSSTVKPVITPTTPWILSIRCRRASRLWDSRRPWSDSKFYIFRIFANVPVTFCIRVRSTRIHTYLHVYIKINPFNVLQCRFSRVRVLSSDRSIPRVSRFRSCVLWSSDWRNATPKQTVPLVFPFRHDRSIPTRETSLEREGRRNGKAQVAHWRKTLEKGSRRKWRGRVCVSCTVLKVGRRGKRGCTDIKALPVIYRISAIFIQGMQRRWRRQQRC